MGDTVPASPHDILQPAPTASGSRLRRTSETSRNLVNEEDWEDFAAAPSSDMSASQASSTVRSRTPLKSRKVATSISRSTTASPRKRPPRSAPAPAPSPRRSASSKTAVPAQQSPPSVLRQSLGLFITTFRVIWTIFDWLLTPVKPYLLLALLLFSTVYLAYCVVIYYALPRLPTFLLRSLGMLLRPLGGWSVPSWLSSLDLASTVSDVDVGRAIGALSLPISGLATTSCALLGVGCEASLYPEAQPLWRYAYSTHAGKKRKPEIDDAQLAWALTQESRSARNIFESISTLGGKADVFEHIEIWKHGVAVSVESKLDDRNVLGKQLFELGDSSKSLHDEMRKIDSMTVTTFGNLHLEFNDLAGQLLSIQLLDPPDRSDTGVTLARRFDNILNRLDPKLDELILRVSHAVDIAQTALDQSKQTTMLLSQISHELNDEISSVPAWKRVSDQVGHYINGGQAPRSKTVRRDLRLVEAVVGDIGSSLDNLERARSALLDYQSHTAGFKASLYGVHLAANGTLDLEAELRILTPLMSEFGTALDSAKEQRFGSIGSRVETRKANIIDPPQQA